MAQFGDAFSYVMAFEDSRLECAIVPDAPPGAHAISGINSAAWSTQYEKIAALPQLERLAAVSAFYQQYFWNALNIGGLESQDLANRVMDEAVNAGLNAGAILLQDAINRCGQTPPVAPDGKIGPLTLEAANGIDPERLIAAYRVQRAQRYQNIVARNPSDEVYLAEWLRRAEQ